MGCNFSDLNMNGHSFCESKVKDCSFNETNLQKADFRNTDLTGTVFHHANLIEADFRDAINYSIDPTANKIRDARFSSPEVLSLLKFLDIQIS